jgi:hypothetical protein
MFAAAFIGLTVVSFTILARLGAPVPDALLIAGWKIFGFCLLSMGWAGLACATAAPPALGALTMMTAGFKFVQAA